MSAGDSGRLGRDWNDDDGGLLWMQVKPKSKLMSIATN